MMRQFGSQDVLSAVESDEKSSSVYTVGDKMNIILKFLKWQFVPSGIVVVEESGRISLPEALKRMLSGVGRRDVKGPNTMELAAWARLKKQLKRYRCVICGLYFWSWKKRDACYKWSCVKRS